MWLLGSGGSHNVVSAVTTTGSIALVSQATRMSSINLVGPAMVAGSMGVIFEATAGPPLFVEMNLNRLVVGSSVTLSAPVASNTQQQQARAPAEAVPSRWAWLRERLTSWAALPDDWDGEDGTAPSSKVTDNASDFLWRAEIAGAPLPEPYVAGDGEVGYRWRSSDSFASASFLPDGHIAAFARSPNRPNYRLDEPYAADLGLGGFFERLKEFA
jgi:hypothetical protein